MLSRWTRTVVVWTYTSESIGTSMNNIRSYFRRYNLALRGKDDHRLVESARAPLANLAEELRVQCGQLNAQLAGCMSERDQLAAHYAELGAQRVQLFSHLADCLSDRDQLAARHS